MPIYKRCSLCGKRIAANEKCKCYEKNNVRNRPDCDKYYSSSEWQHTRAAAMHKTFGLDIFAFYEYGIITYAFTVHHIVPLEEDYTRRADQSNLIPLTEKNHRYIHEKYKNPKEKSLYINKLRNLLVRFEREYRGKGVGKKDLKNSFYTEAPIQ